MVAGTSPSSSELTWDPPWTGRSSISGRLSLTHTHSAWGNVDTPFTSLACLWDVGRNRSPQKKSPQIWGECANSYRQWPWRGIHFFPRQHYNERTLKERRIFKYCTRHFFNDDTSSLTRLAFLSPDSSLCLSSNESITTLG